MNATVRKLLDLADDYAMSSIKYGIFAVERQTARQDLQDELEQLFTPQDLTVAGLAIDLAEHGLTELHDE